MTSNKEGQSQALLILSSSSLTNNVTPRSFPEKTLLIHPHWSESSSAVLDQLFLPRPVPIASNIGNKRKRQHQQQQQQQQQQLQNNQISIKRQEHPTQNTQPREQHQLLQTPLASSSSSLGTNVTTPKVMTTSTFAREAKSLSHSESVLQQLVAAFESKLPPQLLK